MFREYFLVYLPSKQQKQIQSNSHYDNIKEVLMSNISKIRLNSILFLCQSIFDRFLTWLQKERPLVHLLYNALCDLYRTVLLSFLSPEHVRSTYGGALLDIDFKLAEKQLTTKKLQIDLHVLDPASRTKQDSADTMIRVGRAIPKLLKQLSLKSLADREKEQSEKHEHTNEEMKKLIDRENQLLSKQKGLHDKQKKAQLLVGESRQRLDNALKKADIINAQAANALIGAGDEQGKLISDELFKITDELSKIQKTSLLTLPWCSSIKCLIVDGDFSFESLNCLFRYLPQLHRLSINFLKKINNIEMDKNLSMIQLKHLKYVSLKMSAFIPFDWFKVLTKTFFRHLQTLRLTARVGEEY
ncbi:unnamed protein product [Rotaria magnacalcarata]